MFYWFGISSVDSMFGINDLICLPKLRIKQTREVLHITIQQIFNVGVGLWCTVAPFIFFMKALGLVCNEKTSKMRLIMLFMVEVDRF